MMSDAFTIRKNEFRNALNYFADACEKFGADPVDEIDQIITESGLDIETDCFNIIASGYV